MLLLLHLFALFLLVLLGFYVFVENPRSRANQTFAVFIAILALWTVKDLVFWNFPDDIFSVELWASASFIVALLMQYSLVVFAAVFPENSPIPRAKFAVLFAPGAVLIPAAMCGFLWRSVAANNGIFIIDLAPTAFFYVAYVYFVFSCGAYILWTKFRKYRGTQMGLQLGAVLWGLGITVLLKTIANIILPYFDNYTLLPLSALFVLPGVLIYAYAISNFKLLSIQTALDRFSLFPLTYKIALSIASVAIISFLAFQIPIVWWSFNDGMNFDSWRKYLVFSIISALVPNLLLVLLIVRSISRPLERITLAAVRVINGEYGNEVEMRKSNDEIGLLAESFNEMSRKMADDINRLRSLNEQLIRTEKLAAMGTLAAGVAHEVNNPLASISSLIQIIRSQNSIDAATKEKLNLISGQINRISQVTKDMMDFARARPAALSLVNLNEIIHSVLRLASFDKEFAELQTVVEADENLPEIFGDADRLQQVFLNLLLNAKDAMPDGGTVSIRTSFDKENVSISITDSGSGIEKNALKKIFDPFYTTKTANGGTGLGLAVCYGIITAHNGKFEVDSGKSGTTFKIILPAG